MPRGRKKRRGSGIRQETYQESEEKITKAQNDTTHIIQTNREIRRLPDGTQVTREMETKKSSSKTYTISKVRTLRKNATESYFRSLLGYTVTNSLFASLPCSSEKPTPPLHVVIQNELKDLKAARNKHPHNKLMCRADAWGMLHGLTQESRIWKILMRWLMDYCEWLPFYLFEQERNKPGVNGSLVLAAAIDSDVRGQGADCTPIRMNNIGQDCVDVDFRKNTSSKVVLSSVWSTQLLQKWNPGVLLTLQQRKWDYFHLLEKMGHFRSTRLQRNHERFQLFLEEWRYMDGTKLSTYSRTSSEILRCISQDRLFRDACHGFITEDLRQTLTIADSHLTKGNPYVHSEAASFPQVDSYFIENCNPLLGTKDHVKNKGKRLRCFSLLASFQQVSCSLWLPVDLVRKHDTKLFSSLCIQMKALYERSHKWNLVFERLNNNDDADIQGENFKKVIQCENLFGFSAESIQRYNQDI
jgi:hypothetical protein